MKEKFALAFQKLAQHKTEIFDIKVEMDEEKYTVRVFDKETGRLLDIDQFNYNDADGMLTRDHNVIYHLVRLLIMFMIE